MARPVLAVGVLACFVVVLLARAEQKAAPGVVEAKAFIVRDDQNRCRAKLGMLPGHGGDGIASLDILDRDGNLRLFAGVSAAGVAEVTLSDRRGKAVISLSVNPEQPPRVGLRNPSGSSGFSASLDEQNRAFVRVTGGNDADVILGFDASGAPIVSMDRGAGKGLVAFSLDDDGTVRSLSTKSTGAGRLETR